MNSPNIIFIILDTLRADRVLSTCNHVCLTPYIKTLLNNSIYFENCIANNTWTLPSHITMFTGLFPSQNMLITKDPHNLSNKIPVISEILKDLGYYTISYSENPYVSKRYGLIRGFDEVFCSSRVEWIIPKNASTEFTKFLDFIGSIIKKKVKILILMNIWQLIRNIINRINEALGIRIFWKSFLFSYKHITSKGLEELRKNLKKRTINKPFFIFFNIMATHDPYIPCSKGLKKLGIKIKDFKTLKKNIFNFTSKLRIINKIDVKGEHLSNKKVRIMNKFYNGCVYSGDVVIKEIFSLLNNSNLLENSYVIITSDHGEHLCGQFDHYLWGHNTLQSVYKPVIKVPLIIFNNKYAKRIVKKQVQLRDLFHTILHMTNIPAPKNKYLEPNNSILSQLEDKSMPEYIYGEYLKTKEVLNGILRFGKPNKDFLALKILYDIYFIRSNEYIYINYGNGEVEEFFDILNDPYAQHNIFDVKNEFCRKMKDYLEIMLIKNKNNEKIKMIITENEKDIIKNIIGEVKMKGI